VVTQDHLHQCQHQNRQQWKINQITAMSQDKYNTPQPMATLWLEGVKQGMENPEEIIASPPIIPHIAEEQTKIVWHQILKGCIAKQWIQYQQEAM
jgi:hypothetical protein